MLAERMAPPGIELIVAARADAIVPALVIGLGGIWTELLDDVAIVPLPAGAGADRAGAAIAARRAAVDWAAGARAPVDLRPRSRGSRERVGELLVEESLELIELNPCSWGRAERSRSMPWCAGSVAVRAAEAA